MTKFIFFFFFVFFCSAAVSAYVEAYDVIVKGPVAEYLALSQKIGGDVQKHVGPSSAAKICLVNTTTSSLSWSLSHMLATDFIYLRSWC